MCEDLDIIKKQKKLEIKADFKLEVGKTYKTRNGRMIVIVKKREDDKYPFVSDRTGYIYSPEGYYNINRKTSCDLVCEVKEKPSLGLKVGKRYKTRSYDIVTIVEKRNSGTHPFVTEDGGFTSSREERRQDIVREIE